MSNGTLDPLWLSSYEEYFLTEVHTLLFLGYSAARSRIHSNCEEDVITGFLTEALEIEVDKSDFRGRYEVQEQKPVHSKTRTGKRRQQIDLVFKGKDSSNKREFCCEAKRLKKNSNPIGDYSGDEGMGCFVNCEYASDQPEAAMLGYIQSPTMDYWCKQLQKSSEKQTSLNMKSSPAPVSIIPELSQEWLSRHTRTNGKDVDIYHIFLDCS